jgi:hypothetical protein
MGSKITELRMAENISQADLAAGIAALRNIEMIIYPLVRWL